MLVEEGVETGDWGGDGGGDEELKEEDGGDYGGRRHIGLLGDRVWGSVDGIGSEGLRNAS